MEADVVHGYALPLPYSPFSSLHRHHPSPHQRQSPRHRAREVRVKPVKLVRSGSEQVPSRSRSRREDVHWDRKAEGREKEVTLIDLSESVPDVNGREKREKREKEAKEREGGEEESSYLTDLAGLSFDSEPPSSPQPDS